MSDDGARRKGLGRGLAALLGESDQDGPGTTATVRGARELPIEYLRPNPYQPRRHWDEEQMDALVRSVRERGILQPILARRIPDVDDAFEIIAGERRWRAAQAAQMHTVPVIIRDLTDGDSLEISIIENVQREDLTPIEEAGGYKRLIEEFNYTQDQLARAIGKSRSHIANTLRLLTLPDEVQRMLDDGRLSAGAARAVINADDPVAAARTVVEGGFNVRQAERLRKRQRKSKAPPQKEKDADTRALEHSLAMALGLAVAIEHRGATGGIVQIRYRTLEQLDEICRRLSRHVEDIGEQPFAPVGALYAPERAETDESSSETGDDKTGGGAGESDPSHRRSSSEIPANEITELLSIPEPPADDE